MRFPGKDSRFSVQTVLVMLVLLWLVYKSNQQGRTDRIEITNNGHTVVVLEANKDGDAELRMIGKDGQVMTITPAGITGWNKYGTSFQLQNGGPSRDALYGPGLMLFDNVGMGENRAALYLSKGSPFLTFTSHYTKNGPEGKERHTVDNLLMQGTSETASIVLKDKSGNAIWHSASQE